MAGTGSIVKQHNSKSYKNSQYLNQILFKTFVRKQRKLQFSIKTITNNHNYDNSKNKSVINNVENSNVEMPRKKSNFLSFFNINKMTNKDNNKNDKNNENETENRINTNINTKAKNKSSFNTFRRRELFLRILDFNFFVVF